MISGELLTSAAINNPMSVSNLYCRTQINVGNDDTSIPTEGVNGVAVYGKVMAVAVGHANKQANGVIAFYTLDDNGYATFQKEVFAGVFQIV